MSGRINPKKMLEGKDNWICREDNKINDDDDKTIVVIVVEE